jgi:hypothetical protein
MLEFCLKKRGKFNTVSLLLIKLIENATLKLKSARTTHIFLIIGLFIYNVKELNNLLVYQCV